MHTLNHNEKHWRVTSNLYFHSVFHTYIASFVVWLHKYLPRVFCQYTFMVFNCIHALCMFTNNILTSYMCFAHIHNSHIHIHCMCMFPTCAYKYNLLLHTFFEKPLYCFIGIFIALFEHCIYFLFSVWNNLFEARDGLQVSGQYCWYFATTHRKMCASFALLL